LLGAFLRTLFLGALALALARPARRTTEERSCTVFAVDVSQSVTDAQLAAARGFVEQAVDARGRNDVRLLTFAEDAHAIDLDPRRPVPTFARHERGQGTNLQAALRLSYALFPPDRLRRVVVLSDGNETAGDLGAEAERARRAGVRVHAWALPPAGVRDVAVA